LQAHYVTVVEDRPIMSVKYCLPVAVFYFWPKRMHHVVSCKAFICLSIRAKMIGGRRPLLHENLASTHPQARCKMWIFDLFLLVAAHP